MTALCGRYPYRTLDELLLQLNYRGRLIPIPPPTRPETRPPSAGHSRILTCSGSVVVRWMSLSGHKFSTTHLLFTVIYSTFTAHSPCTRRSAGFQEVIMKKKAKLGGKTPALSQNYNEVW